MNLSMEVDQGVVNTNSLIGGIRLRDSLYKIGSVRSKPGMEVLGNDV